VIRRGGTIYLLGREDLYASASPLMTAVAVKDLIAQIGQKQVQLTDCIASHPSSRPVVDLNRSYAFIRGPEKDQDPAHNWYTNPDAAEKVVDGLARMGVKVFLITAGNFPYVVACRTMGKLIAAAGLQFFTDEKWEWIAAVDATGDFQPTLYIKNRIQRDLEPLKDEFPSAFAGFYFRDEPGVIDFNALCALSDCLHSQPRFSEMPISLNLLGINTNYAALSGLNNKLGGGLPLENYGINCAAGEIEDRSKLQEMITGYGKYVTAATKTVGPDLLSFDLYPFVEDDCEVRREVTVSENLRIIGDVARVYGRTPVAFLQNWRAVGGFRAGFHHLRWFASWAFAFGVRDFATLSATVRKTGERVYLI
jgi:hypothetical protein